MDNLITENLLGAEIKFKTRPGVFAKGGVDHGSRLLLKKTDLTKIPDKGLVADLGCGSGVVGLAIAKHLFKSHVHLLDANLRAVELAKENAELNSLKNAEVFLSDLFSAVKGRSYHLILSNPPQSLGNQFLEEMVAECFRHLKPKGELVWVVKSNLKSAILRIFAKFFTNSTIVTQSREYALVKGVKDG